MDNQALQKLKQALNEAESLGIVVAQNPTVDEMGAALSLYLSLKAAHKKVSIASPTDPIVELSSLVAIDQVKPSLGGSAAGDLVVSFPYKEGEIEKVSYTLESGYLNIVVKAGELGLNFNDDEVRFTHGGGAGNITHLIVVGAARISDLGNLYNPEEMKDVSLINIDNKADNQGFGEIVLVSPRLSSVSEMVAETLLSANLPLDVDIAQNLLSGIAFATSNFQDPKTSFLAFEMAGELMRLGAVRQMTPPVQRPGAIPTPRPQPARYPAMNPGVDDYADMMQAPYPQPMPRPTPQPRMGGQQPQQRMPQASIGTQNPIRAQMPRMQNPMSRQPQQRMGQNPMNQPRMGGQPQPGRMPQMQDRGAQNPMAGRQQPRMSQQPMGMPQVSDRGPQMPAGVPTQQMHPPMQPQSTRSRQDEIREELARAAAQQGNPDMMGGNPSTSDMNGQYSDEPMAAPAAPQPRPQSNGRPSNPPADWLTPKVYKGSTDI